MLQKIPVFLFLCISTYTSFFFVLFALLITSCTHYRSNITSSSTEISQSQKDAIVESALNQEFPVISPVVSEYAYTLREKIIKKVKEADYVEAIGITLSGLKKIPENFRLQFYLAALLGDASEITSEPLKSRMVKKSKAMFDRLLIESEKQPKEIFYHFKNEYFFRLALYREQYDLGVKRVADYWGTNQWDAVGVDGYYCQGVGASNHAKALLINGNKQQAREYAQKALTAWAQYFSYKNDYYNAYVHYALALGILDYHVEMVRALQRSAAIINRDLSYHEFKEVTDFFESHR